MILWQRTQRLLISLMVFLIAVPAVGEEVAPAPDPAGFGPWLGGVREEALGAGISGELLDRVLAAIEFNPRVIELDRRQPEFTQTFEAYMAARVTAARIARGQERSREFSDLLSAVGEQYGVEGHFIAAIWGMETNYGSHTGGMDVIGSLATLAYDGRRSAFFRKELMAALKILNEGHIDFTAMKGSWAGAMGQSQFMPSSFHAYAEDFDGDGRRDIWLNPADVFASIANYLKRHKWQSDVAWGREVILPPGFEAFEAEITEEKPPRACRRALKEHSRQLPLSSWYAMGVRGANGEELPQSKVLASLVRPAGNDGPAFLTYANYRSILSYNCSNFYALAVGHIADALLAKPEPGE
jgi:membrane-bound lytic murein transglycosylase B